MARSTRIDNLGIYELLRRRCRLIIAIDAEADPKFDGASLIQVERFARIDMNVIIRMNWKPIATRSRAVSEEIGKNELKSESGPHIAVGVIDYPPAPGGTEREKGVLVYIKASLSGDENDYVIAYKAAHRTFPHESTADQLFSEEQFEAYRALGEHMARRFLDGRDPVSQCFPSTGPISSALLTRSYRARPLAKINPGRRRSLRLIAISIQNRAKAWLGFCRTCDDLHFALGGGGILSRPVTVDAAL